MIYQILKLLLFNDNNLNMKNISKFITEKLKVKTNTQNLPTWKEFTNALDNFPEQEFSLSEYCEEFKDADIKDYPTFINHGIDRYPESGHIMVLVADYMTPINQSIIIYFKHKSMLSAFDTIRLYVEDYKVLIDSLGEDLYLEIYNKMKEQNRN